MFTLLAIKRLTPAFTFVSLLFLYGCSDHSVKIDRSFYYWKTTFQMSDSQVASLKELRVKKIYLRFFDVDWDESRQTPHPVAQVTFSNPPDTSLEIIPVVYITNKTLLKTSVDSIRELAPKLWKKVVSIASRQKIIFAEMQLDCDWTLQTREKYFTLIKELQKKMVTDQKDLSVTIRLHQAKYPDMTGIPDVKKGMLMFYNMGKLSGERNSIYNEKDANTYIHALKSYPLDLDAVLPSFCWTVQLRNKKIIGLLNETITQNLDLSHYKLISKNQYQAKSSFFFHGHYIMKDDILKVEEMDPATTISAAEKLSGALIKQNRSVAIFNLDSPTLSRYEKKDLETIFNCFR